jgi:adenosine deaminase
VLVEICLTSNDLILGVEGANHPLPAYISHGVPVALATDDEGVSRSDMTREYVRAIETYHFPYSQMKRMARQSLEHSFLAGPSLWQETQNFHVVSVCALDRPENDKRPSPGCDKFLAGSDRAKTQWNLEKEFVRFEKKY